MMRKVGIILIAWLSLGFIQDFNPQSKEITAKFFPEMDIDINTPAFKKSKGFTNYAELIAFLNTLQQKHPSIMSIRYIGESQKGKSIPLVTLAKNSGEKKLKVWFQGGLHGDEMASTEGMLYLLDKLLSDSNYSYLLNRLEIAIVPMANIDGYENENRYVANGLDLNRDQTKLIIKESVVLKQAFSDYNADVAVDFHEFRPYRKEFTQFSTYGITARHDVMFMSSGNLNVPEKLRKYTNQKFVKNAELALDKVGLTHREYLTSEKALGDIHFNQGSNNARSSSTSYALANTISSLIEVRGVGLGRTSFKRRIFTTFMVGVSYLTSAYQNVDEVKDVLKSATASNPMAVVTSGKEVSTQPLTVIDLETTKEITIDVEIHNASNSRAILTRTRPTAYLIDAGQTALIEKLHILGITTKVLNANTTIEVEGYTVKEYERATEKEEGVFQQKVKAEVSTQSTTLLKGTYVVDMNQENANLAIEVLEPEAPNSFVTFGILPTHKNAVLPIYRYLKNEKLY
jgi:hypothetical protein